MSLTENVDSPTGTNIRCLYAHMGTITNSASPSASPTDSLSVCRCSSLFISYIGVEVFKNKCRWCRNELSVMKDGALLKFIQFYLYSSKMEDRSLS